MQLGQTIEGNLQLDAAGGINLDEVNKFPRDHPRRNLGEKQMQRGCRNHALQQAADRAPRAHVHRAKLEHHVVVAKLLVDVNVVDPHNLASVDVNDLLVEQVALQQEHAFTTGVRDPLRSGGSNPQAAIDQAERLGGQQTVAVAGFHHKARDLTGILLRHQRDFAHFAGGRSGVVDYRRANQVGKCE